MSWLGMVAIGVPLIGCALSILSWALEGRRMRSIRDAPDGPSLTRASSGLPPEVRRAVKPLASAVAEPTHPNVEACLLEVLRSLSRSGFGPAGAWVLAREVLLVGVATAPLVAGLLTAPLEVSQAVGRIESMPLSRALLVGPERLRGPFERLSTAYLESGAAIAALVLLWVLQAWLRSPRVREARCVDALLTATVSLAPQACAPVAGRFAEILAPDRDLERPVLASGFWVVAVTAAWGALLVTAPLRSGQARLAADSAWTTARAKPLQVPPGLRLPRALGGRPIREPASLLAIGPNEARLGSVFVVEWTGALPEDWKARADQNIAAAGGLPEPARMLVAAHDELPAGLVFDVLEFVLARTGGDSIELVMERADGLRQAVLRGRFAAVAPPMGQIQLGPEGRLRADGQPSTLVRLRDRVREELATAERAPQVTLTPHRGASWASVVGLAGELDDACPADRACSGPGVGVRFIFSAAPDPGAGLPP